MNDLTKKQPMNDLIDKLKARIGYTEIPPKCQSCKFFKPDMSTDNFGSGDKCIRNPDITFSVRHNAVCDKHEIGIE